MFCIQCSSIAAAVNPFDHLCPICFIAYSLCTPSITKAKRFEHYAIKCGCHSSSLMCIVTNLRLKAGLKPLSSTLAAGTSVDLGPKLTCPVCWNSEALMKSDTPQEVRLSCCHSRSTKTMDEMRKRFREAKARP